MTGMKEGASEDPFADDDESTESESVEQPDTDDTQTPPDSVTETTDT